MRTLFLLYAKNEENSSTVNYTHSNICVEQKEVTDVFPSDHSDACQFCSWILVPKLSLLMIFAKMHLPFISNL